MGKERKGGRRKRGREREREGERVDRRRQGGKEEGKRGMKVWNREKEKWKKKKACSNKVILSMVIQLTSPSPFSAK